MPTDNSNAFSPQDLTRTEDQNKLFPNARGQVVPAIESAPEEPQDWKTPMAEPEGGWQQEGTPLTIQARPKEVNKILNSKHVLSDVDISDPSNARVFVANFLNSKYSEDKRGIYKDYESKTKAYGLSGDPVADAKSILDGDTKTHESSQTRIAKDRKVIAEGLDRLEPEEGQGFIEKRAKVVGSTASKVGWSIFRSGQLLSGELFNDRLKDELRAEYDRSAGNKVSASNPIVSREELMDFSSQMVASTEKAFGVDPEYANTMEGAVLSGLTQITTQVATAGLGLPAQMYDEGIQDAEASMGKLYSEMTMLEQAKARQLAAPYALVATGLEALPLGKMFKNLTGTTKEVVSKMSSKSFLKEFGAGFLGEGITESAQKQLLGELGKRVLEDGREVWSAESMKDLAKEFLVAGIVGGIARGTPVATSKALNKFMDPVEGMSAVDMALAQNVVPEAEFNVYIEELYGDQTTEEGMPLQELAQMARKGDRSAAEQLVEATTVEASRGAVEAGLTPAEAEARGKEAAEVADPVEPLVETAIDKEISAKKEELAALEEAEESTPKDMKVGERLDKEIQALEAKRDESQRPIDVLSAQAREEAAAEEAGLLTRRAEEEIEIDKAEEVADAIDFFEQRSRGGVTRDYKPDTRKGGETLIKQMRRAGMSKEEIAAKSLQIMTEAGRPQDRLADQVVRGEQTSNSKAGNDFRATVKLYKDADPMDVAEEYIHAETDREVNEGTINYEDIAAYRKQVESITSGEDTRGDTEGDHKEWIAEQVKARLLGNRYDTRLPESFARFIDRIISRLRNLFTRANELIELEAQGMLPDGFVELLDRLGSMDDDALMQSIQAEQVAETASDPKDELLEVMKRNKLSVPRPDSDPSHRGELETYFEGIGKKWKYLKKGGSLDSLREGLQAAGFNVDTPSDVLDLLDRSARGEAIYANTDSRSAAQQTADETFSLAGADVTPDANAQSFTSKDGGVVGPASFSLSAFHGTPHKVDKFSTENIGTGEGLQAYGYGLYFAQNKSVAISYQRGLSANKSTIDGKDVPSDWQDIDGLGMLSGAALRAANGDKDKALESLRSKMARADRRAELGGRDGASDIVDEAIRELENFDESRLAVPQGSLYEVELNIEQDEFLDWDKPLSEQSDKVKSAINKNARMKGQLQDLLQSKPFKGKAKKVKELELQIRSGLDFPVNKINRASTGGSIYGIIFGSHALSPQEASEALYAAGIKGIRYLDGSSRAAGEGNSNYVVFNDSDITVTHENGEAVALPKPEPSFSLAPDTPAFKEWFGDSKVVDENGEPLVVYHGTNENFEAFDLGTTGKASDEGAFSKGFYFAKDSDYANSYAKGEGANVQPAFLSLQNPLVISSKSDIPDVDVPESTIEEMLEAPAKYSAKLREVLQRMGYDGVIVQMGGPVEYVAFDPTQIKSATGNRGTFDPNDPRINYSLEPLSEQDAVYLSAVESDNMEAAQEMVDEQARMRGYNPLIRLFHGTKKRFDRLKSTRDPNGLIYFSTNEEMAQTYPRGVGGHRTPEADVQARLDDARLKSREYTNPAFEKLEAEYGNDIPMDLVDEVFAKEKEIQRSLLDGMTHAEANMSMGIRVIGGYIKAEDIFEPSNWREFKDVIMESIGVESEADILPQMMDAIESGNYIIWEKKAVVDAVLSKYDAMTIQETSGKPAETIAFRDPSQIKSSDPVTYDADGNVIPLSERFDPTRDEVNYSLEPLSEQDAEAIVTERTEEIQSRTPERQAFIDYQRELRKTQLDNTEEEKEKLQKLLQLATDADEIAALKQAGDEKIIRVVEQKVKQIRKQAAEREDVTESVKALERLINSPEVPMEVRARMRGFGRLAERKTPQGKARWVEQMANKLEAEIDRHYRTRNVRTLRSLLRPFATEYAPNRRKLRERVGEEARADLNFAQRLLNNSEATPPEGMTDERRDELVDIFGDVGNRQSNPTRVKAALEIAGSIAKGGRTARDDFKEDRRQRNEQVGDLVREEVLNGEEAMGKSQIAAREKQRNAFKKGYDYMRSRLIRGMEGFQQQLNKMDSVKGGILEDLFLPAVYQADQNEKALNREHVERVNEDFKTVLGTDNKVAASWYKNSHELHDTDIEWIEDKAIGMEKRTISKQQGVALFMQWLDPSLRSTFSNMGINESTIEQVKEFIGEIGVSEAYYFRERYAEMGIKLNAKHIEVEGIPLDMIDGYGGRARRINSVGSRQEDMQMFSTNSAGRPTVKSGSMKERTNSTDYLIFQDAAMDFSAHAKEVNHYISHAELAKNLSAAFLNNARARNAITQKHGADFYESLKDQVEAIIEGDPKITNKTDRDWNRIRSNVTKAQLMAKPAILIKQLTSAPAFVEEIGPVAYAKASASLTRNARKFMPMIWGSEYVKNRMSNSQFADIQQQLDQRDNTLKGLRWDDYAMMNVKWGDIGAVIAGGAPVYVHAYNEAKAAGMTNDQAQAKAEEVFGLSSERAQQSSATHAKGAFLRGKGAARTWFMYLTSPLQYQRNVNTGIANLVANVFEKKAGRKSDVKKAANQALRAIVIYHVLLPQIFQAVASGLVGFTDDEDYIKEQFWAKQRRALYAGNLNAIPLAGQLITVLANLAAGTGESWDSSGSPIIDLVGEIKQDFEKAVENGDDLSKWLELSSSAGLAAGIPVKTINNYYDAITDISEGNTEHPLLRAGGWSKWSIFED